LGRGRSLDAEFTDGLDRYARQGRYPGVCHEDALGYDGKLVPAKLFVFDQLVNRHSPGSIEEGATGVKQGVKDLAEDE
jgi:hypothetical protein